MEGGIKKVWFERGADSYSSRWCSRSWFTRRVGKLILSATDSVQINNYQLLSSGHRIHQPYIDEDLSLEGFFTYNIPAEISRMINFFKVRFGAELQKINAPIPGSLAWIASRF